MRWVEVGIHEDLEQRGRLMFKKATPEEQAAKDAAKAEKDRQAAAKRAEQERQAFLRTPVGRARSAFERGDHLFQYAHDVESQDAVIVSMVGSTTNRSSSDPSEILNAVAREGWELVNASFVFREQGQQSRDKFLSSGQNVAIKGTTVGYYVFRRAQARSTDVAAAA
jgi:hypothetical protein